MRRYEWNICPEVRDETASNLSTPFELSPIRSVSWSLVGHVVFLKWWKSVTSSVKTTPSRFLRPDLCIVLNTASHYAFPLRGIMMLFCWFGDVKWFYST